MLKFEAHEPLEDCPNWVGSNGSRSCAGSGEVEVIEPDQFHVRTREYEIFKSTNYLKWISEKKVKPIGMREIRDRMRSPISAS